MSAEPIAFVTEPGADWNSTSRRWSWIPSRNRTATSWPWWTPAAQSSFVKHSVYLAYRKCFACYIHPTNRKFVNIKDLPLEVIGTVKVKLTMSLLKQKRFDVTLFVINENSNILPVDDNYSVSVRLKDKFVYTFAPRRFAYSEFRVKKNKY